MAANSDSVHVRMYNVGFGDCFLLTFPGVGGGRGPRVLIDCGSIASASMSMSDVVGTIIGDVTDSDDVPRIDVVICTHRHADHVSGFADSRWKSVQVREVWMPWTEDPKNAEAKRIRESQSRLAAALANSWAAKLAAGAPATEVEGFQQIAVNALSNAAAMQTLHKGFKGGPKRKFLAAPDQVLNKVKSSTLPGITTYVLGPSKSEEVIRDMDPPAGKTYLKRVSVDGLVNEPFEPFGPEWGLLRLDYRWDSLLVSPEEAKQLRDMSDMADPAITVALDKAVNGTSLVMVFELGDAVLLFPGDAQWGTWNEILASEEAKELISRATFVKVGHHGSHNATPREFVDDVLRANCCAMMSTKTGKWASIPRQRLVEALEEKTKFARSDVQKARPAAPFTVRSKSLTEAFIKV